jgi:hypothetical protein
MARSCGNMVADRGKYRDCIQPGSEIVPADVVFRIAAREQILQHVRIYP